MEAESDKSDRGLVQDIELLKKDVRNMKKDLRKILKQAEVSDDLGAESSILLQT